MNNIDFQKLIEETNKKELQTLNSKASEYAEDDDRLINFKETAAWIQTTPAASCWYLMAKHLQSIHRMVMDDYNHYSKDYIDEKIGDARNYLLLLKAILYEKNLS